MWRAEDYMLAGFTIFGAIQSVLLIEKLYGCVNIKWAWVLAPSWGIFLGVILVALFSLGLRIIRGWLK